MVREIKIGTTTYAVERLFVKDAKETAVQAIRRLLLQKATMDTRELLSECYQTPLDIEKTPS